METEAICTTKDKFEFHAHQGDDWACVHSREHRRNLQGYHREATYTLMVGLSIELTLDIFAECGRRATALEGQEGNLETYATIMISTWRR